MYQGRSILPTHGQVRNLLQLMGEGYVRIEFNSSGLAARILERSQLLVPEKRRSSWHASTMGFSPDAGSPLLKAPYAVTTFSPNDRRDSWPCHFFPQTINSPLIDQSSHNGWSTPACQANVSSAVARWITSQDDRSGANSATVRSSCSRDSTSTSSPTAATPAPTQPLVRLLFSPQNEGYDGYKETVPCPHG